MQWQQPHLFVGTRCATAARPSAHAHSRCVATVAMQPLAVVPDQIPADIVAREKAIFEEQTKDMGKPELAEKIVAGKLAKYYKEVCLLDQDFVKDTNRLQIPIQAEDVWDDTDENFYDKIRGQRIVKGYGTRESVNMALNS